LKFLQKAANVEGHLHNLAGKGFDDVNLNHNANSNLEVPG